MSSFAGQPSTSSISSPAYSETSPVVCTVQATHHTLVLTNSPQKGPSPDIALVQEQPIRPPGLLPLPGERLWKPHEDKYWSSIREMWGSNLDLTDPDNEDSVNRFSTYDNHTSRHQSKDDIQEDDLETANGTVFRIVLPNQPQKATIERDNDLATAGGRTSSERIAGAPRNSINHTPLSNAIALHLPPYVPPRCQFGPLANDGFP